MCDVGSKVELILSSLEGRKHPVRNIVLMEKPPVELITRAEQCGIDVTSMEGMEVSSLFGFFWGGGGWMDGCMDAAAA